MKKVFIYTLLSLSLDLHAFFFGAVKGCEQEESIDFNVYNGSILETKDIMSFLGCQSYIIKVTIKYCKETIQLEIYEYEDSRGVLLLRNLKNIKRFLDINITSDLSGNILHHYHSGIEGIISGSSTGLTVSRWRLLSNLLPCRHVKKFYIRGNVFRQLNILSQIGVDLSGETISFFDTQELWLDTSPAFSEAMTLYTAYSSNGDILFQILLNHSNHVVAFSLNVNGVLYSYWRRRM